LVAKRRHFWRCEHERVGLRIIAVVLQQPLDLRVNRIALHRGQRVETAVVAFRGKRLANVDGQCMQVGGRKIRAKVGPMPPDGAIFHQTVLQKEALTREDIRLGKDRVAGRTDDLRRDGRRIVIDLDRQPDKYREAAYHGQDYGMAPPG
jgi:hypothetical protein